MARLNLIGNFSLSLVDRNGVEVSRRRKNLVVNNGLRHVVDLLQALSVAQVKFIELGQGATTASSTDTALGNRHTVTNSKRAATISEVGISTLRYLHTWTNTEIQNVTVAEAGLFACSAGGSGTILARVTFTAVRKTSSLELKIQWDVHAAG